MKETIENSPEPTEHETPEVVKMGTKSFMDSLVDGLHKPARSIITREELNVVEERALKELNEAEMATDNQEPHAPKFPQFWIDDDIHEKLCKPWRNSVIIKLLGKTISFFAIRARLARDWKTEYEYEIIDVGLSYYVVKFQSHEDCMSILIGGPYKMYDYYLAVQP